MSAPLNLELAFADLVAGIEAPAAQPRRPRIENGEFVLLAGFPAGAIVTSLDRSKKLVHFEHITVSVWRHALGGAALMRVSTWTKCNRWIKFAVRAPWFASHEVCDQCARALRAEGRQVPVPAVDF